MRYNVCGQIQAESHHIRNWLFHSHVAGYQTMRHRRLPYSLTRKATAAHPIAPQAFVTSSVDTPHPRTFCPRTRPGSSHQPQKTSHARSVTRRSSHWTQVSKRSRSCYPKLLSPGELPWRGSPVDSWHASPLGKDTHTLLEPTARIQCPTARLPLVQLPSSHPVPYSHPSNNRSGQTPTWPSPYVPLHLTFKQAVQRIRHLPRGRSPGRPGLYHHARPAEAWV